MNEWHIQSRAHACQACNKQFSDKQPCHTVLADTKQDILRLDFCEACWKDEAAMARDRKGFISHWQGVYEAPPAAPQDPIRKENAETLLRKLMELNEPKNVAASFILAVMLERKRILKVKEQLQRDGGRVFVYEQPRTGDVFTIPDPNLQLNQLEEVQRHVAELLEHGLNPPATPPPQTASPACAEMETAAPEPVAIATDEPVAR